MHEDPIDLQRVQQATFIQGLSYHQQLPSTNSHAMQLAAAPSQTPLLVLAESQTAGRGRGDNQWWSADGGLTFSLLVDRPAFSLRQTLLVSLATGLAICEGLQNPVPTAAVGLKWPNDVHLAGRKVCGILVERAAANAGCFVLGIGVNVNNPSAKAPAAVARRAISLAEYTGESCDRTAVLIELLQAVEASLAALEADPGGTLAKWRTYCLLTDKQVCVQQGLQQGQRRVVGRCCGIDDQGALVVQDERQLHRCVSGTVRLLEGEAV